MEINDKEQMQKELRDIDSQIESLKERSEEAGTVKQDIDKDIDNLRSQAEVLKAQIDDSDGQGTWDEVKENVREGIEEIKEKIKSGFK